MTQWTIEASSIQSGSESKKEASLRLRKIVTDYANGRITDIRVSDGGRIIRGRSSLNIARRLAVYLGRTDPYVWLDYDGTTYNLSDCRDEVSYSGHNKKASEADRWNKRRKIADKIIGTIETAPIRDLNRLADGLSPKAYDERSTKYSHTWGMHPNKDWDDKRMGSNEREYWKRKIAESVEAETRNYGRSNTWKLPPKVIESMKGTKIHYMHLAEYFESIDYVIRTDTGDISVDPNEYPSAIMVGDASAMLDSIFGEHDIGRAVRDYLRVVGRKVIRKQTYVAHLHLSNKEISILTNEMADDMIPEAAYAICEIVSKLVRWDGESSDAEIDTIRFDGPAISIAELIRSSVRRAASRIVSIYKNADSTGKAQAAIYKRSKMRHGNHRWMLDALSEANGDVMTARQYAASAGRYGMTDPAEIAEVNEEREILSKRLDNLTDAQFREVLRVLNGNKTPKGSNYNRGRLMRAMERMGIEAEMVA